MCQIDNEGWSALIGEIQRTERLLPPDEIWAVAATQLLTEHILDVGATITPEARSMLIKIAAIISREANREIMAALQAELVLRRAANV